VIDGHHPAGYLTGALAGIATGIPSLLTTYNVSEIWEPRWLWKLLHQYTLANSSAVVTDSSAVADEVASWMARNRRSRVRVIPNGPPPPVAQRPEADVRRFLGLRPRESTRVVGQIAALSRGKGQHVLLEAAPRVLARHPDVTFLLVGFERPQPGYADVLRAQAQTLGIAERVIVTSYRGEIGDVWQTVDIQVHPTMQDSLPNAILEGMSLGKPVIASDHAGIPDLVLHDRTGIVVPVGSAEAVADGIIRLLDTPDTSQAFGAAARARYLGGYTRDHLVRRMQDVFGEVAASRAR
jgi:glycosyltransferase involved in cell wall biosynthesis